MGIAFQSLKNEDAENCGYVIPTPVVDHFIRDYVLDGTIKLFYCETVRILTDILTKAIPRPQHERLRSQIMCDILSYVDNDLLVQVGYCRAMMDTLTL